MNLNNLVNKARRAVLSTVTKQSKSLGVSNIFPLKTDGKFYVGHVAVDKGIFASGIKYSAPFLSIPSSMMYCHILNTLPESFIQCREHELIRYGLVLHGKKEYWIKVDVVEKSCRIVSFEEVDSNVQKEVLDESMVRLMQGLRKIEIFDEL